MARPEKRKDVQAFLEGKLQFEQDPNGKHESFCIPKKLSIFLPMQLPVNLQHGRGDVKPHIVRQIYQFLGLEYNEFLVGKKCHICASVIYRVLLWKNLVKFVDEYTGNKTAMSAVLEQYLISSEASLDIILNDFPFSNLNKDERKVVLRISEQLLDLKVKVSDYESAFEGRLSTFVERLLRSFG